MNLTAGVLMLSAWAASSAEPVGETPVDFQRQIRGILSDNCYHCHGPDASTREGDLRLDRREDTLRPRDGQRLIEPGNPDASELIRRVESVDADVQMPPPDSGRTLTAEQIVLLRRWVAEGANWRDQWSFTPATRPTLPVPKEKDWPRHPIDAFVKARLEAEGMSPAAEPPMPTLIRRVHLDLVGIPPTLEELDQSLNDSAPDSLERLTDRLLASPRYGEHAALEWLDAARYADSNGYQNDGTRTMWPWRDWVIEALNANLPFDRFTIQQIAGDLIPGASRQELLATGFHRNHMLNGEGGRIPEESRYEYCVDRVDTTATVWLGVTMACSRCHDHKYDPFTRRDYYSLFAYFNSIDEVGSVDRGGNANPVMKLPSDMEERRLAEAKTRLSAIDAQLDSAPDLSEGAQLAWEDSVLAKAREEGRQPIWTTLVADETTSREKATMSQRDDLSILVTGVNPERDDYRVVAPLSAGRLTAFLLETLPDPAFTKGGLARSDSGNFVLTEFRATLRPSAGGAEKPMVLASAVADYEQAGYGVSASIDGNPSTGWAVLSESINAPRRALFVLQSPIDVEEGSRIELVLEHNSAHAHHNIGRFRLSTTGESVPTLPAAGSVPDYVLAALLVASADRSAIERSAIVDAFHREADLRPGLRRQRDQLQKELDDIDRTIVETMVLRERAEPRKTFVHERGLYDKPDESQPMDARIPEVLGQLPTDSPRNRMTLARWLVDPSNPLTARVTVNRWWQQLWGQGLVRTPEDFGSQGELPTHPELLDWLAVELIDYGWNVKEFHRAVVTSATYRQSSSVVPAQRELDPENRLIGRGPRQRISSLALRDQALAIAGLAVDAMGGPGVNPYQPADVWTDFSLGKIQYKQDAGASLYRRSIYTYWRRSVGPTMFFDASSRQTCTVRPRLTNTPLHALTLLNDPTFVEAARVWAWHVLADAGPTDRDRLRVAFRQATCRQATPQETDLLLGQLEAARSAFAGDPASADEFLTVGERKLPPREAVEWAAYSAVMSVILNLDEVVTKE